MFALAAALAAAAPSAAAISQPELDTLARDLGIRFTVIDNNPDDCPGGQPGCFLSELQVRLPERLPSDFTAEDFRLYFGFLGSPQKVDSDQFEIELVNGDLHVLKARRGARLEGGKSYKIRIWSGGHFYSSYYVMPNMYLAPEGLTARVVRATQPVVDPETQIETVPFVAAMSDEANLATGAPGNATQWRTPERAFALYSERLGAPIPAPEFVVIPTPAKISRLVGAPLDLRRGASLQVSGVAREALQPALNQLVAAGVGGLSAGPELSITVAPGAGLVAEGYRVTTSSAGRGAIQIRAADAAGAAHAVRSLAQQVAHEGGMLRPLAIEDAPRFAFRGLHLDVARNFHSKAEVVKLLDQMAAYKLNRLHLHLGEDEAWRLEIKQLPELTEVGGYRCHDPAEDRCLLPMFGAGPDGSGVHNGFFSQADYLDILAAAKARNIEVIPSFDMPGHSRAAIRSMEARYRRLMKDGTREEAERYRLVEPADTTKYRSVQNYNDNTLNVCLDSTYRFLDTVLGEVAALHAAAGTPLKTYHIGADETAGAWTDSPACKRVMASTGRDAKSLGAMFIERVAGNLSRQGILTAGWSDGLGHTDPAKMPKNVQSNIWGNLFAGGVAEGHDHANRGWRAVISVPNVTYLDSPYAPDPMERGLDWPSRDTDTFKVFALMPENLPANISVMKDLNAQPAQVSDTTPLRPGIGIYGLQGQLWSETVRSDSQVEYMLFPRLIALAERGWHEGSWEPVYKPGESYKFGDGKVDRAALQRDYAGFAARLGAHQRLLDAAGVDYRLAPPGARLVGGTLHAIPEFPGTAIEYRIGDGQWQPYSAPVAVSGPVELRTRTPDGRRASRSVRIGG
ncbi:beta-N-acetylhexosaminidase [Sphingomonas parva]|uniref:beta-N-acetylhexosaminidase n=2 Tax=Sphingomonas parva TaxID=2555898 RepID=A0A4Y8ZU99_9SPHN|nr:beta-N-acetylhexosaminidase [Sphingomonas parva]